MSQRAIPVPLSTGAILMILLGLARGSGGFLLLVNGASAVPGIKAGEAALVLVASGLVIIGVLEIIAAVGIFQLKKKYWLLGIIVTILFVILGFVNGYILFGKIGDQGTVVNIAAAVAIIAFLLVGKKHLKE